MRFSRVFVALGLVATASVCGGSGNSSVTGATGGGGGSGGPNEPSGFTRYSERGFNTEPPNGGAEDGWVYEDPPSSGVTIVQDPTAPKSPPNVGQALFPAGFPSGSGPTNAERSITGSYTRLYLAFWLKVSANWSGNDGAGTNKVFFVWIHGKPAIYIKYEGSGSAPLYPQVSTQNTPNDHDPLSSNVNFTKQVVRGQWHLWEVLLIANTGGSANGTVRWWVDGTLVGDHTDVQIASAGQSHAWENVAWNPTYGGVGSPVPAAQYQWMDHVYISVKP